MTAKWTLPLCHDCQLIRHNDYSCPVALGYCLDCCGCPAHIVPAARPKEHLGLFSLTKIKNQMVRPEVGLPLGLLVGMLLSEVLV